VKAGGGNGSSGWQRAGPRTPHQLPAVADQRPPADSLICNQSLRPPPAPIFRSPNMYLARRTVNGQLQYFISRSYQEGRWWRSEDLLQLGPNPTSFIRKTGRDSFYVHEVIEKKLRDAGEKVGCGEVEQLFLTFVSKSMQNSYDQSSFRNNYHGRTRLSYYEERRLQNQISLFDRRRLLFLKTGALDLSGVSTLPIRYFMSLADKSRDEIEQSLLVQEAQLKPGEYKSYAYASLNLQKFFAQREARTMPQFLDQERLDQVFVDELCRINGSYLFWMGKVPGKYLHPYLMRYLIMFFDWGWEAENYWEAYIRRFMDSHRQHRPPSFATRFTEEEADELFGMGRDELRKLSRRELTSLYKKKAKELHPDKGGDHEKFILLTRAFKALVRDSRKR
jgi:hypothetical protein